MKTKLLALFCCLAAAFAAQAQDSPPVNSSGKTFKSTKGDITTEVAVNLEHYIFLNGSQLKLRKFYEEGKALRLGVRADYDYNKLGVDAYQTSIGINITPGIEKHFAGTNRLSPYIGAELPLGYWSSKEETEDYMTKGGWGSTAYAANRSNFNVGLNGLAGVDYYFASRFYAGFEVGVGLQYRKNKDVVTTYKNDSNHMIEHKGYHSISFSPFSTRGIRLGFAF
ncbi:hypothetical protein H9Q13_17415 [Pontibacter sp. JH31]|uniref:Outer membrane protein beta-barrel domain-containing protein n=1 Tax=Pontibacter aquaedesilientis TaxID=2766980 RepID=A0ABR7XMS8_9BACT|nr:BT1926 family outer membrane beta-barrel protein [Pontibacter aquaedesilientis]MBD1398953.1 hypothetical protein [Pontibacter aquaedesilientis]